MIFNNIKTKKGAFLLLLMISLLSSNSCSDDFGDINDSFQANLTDATIPGLFNGLIQSVKKGETRNRVPVSWLYQWTQLAAMYTASGFRLDDKTTEAWEKYYRSLANYHDIENLIAAEEDPENFTNIQAMARTIMAYQALSTTLLYGDIPYSEAGQGFLSAQAYRPVYDSQQSIMQAAINDLTWAIDNLSTNASQATLGGFDTLLDNDVDMWKKFANSLRLRYAMVMREKDAGFADPIITAALSQPLLEPAEFVSLNPASIPGLSNDRRGFYRGNSYVRMGSTMWEVMSSTNDVDGSGIYDLRCSILFEPNENDEWVPYPQNPDNTTPTVTGDPHVNDRLDDWDSFRSNFASINAYYTLDNDIPQFIITGSQISFLKAEIYNRGVGGVTADQTMAETFYNEGITASVNFWYNYAFNSAIWAVNKPDAAAPSDAEINAMLTNPNVAYSADVATALSQIYEQSWISLFHQPFEAWNLQRRTDNATPNVPLAATSLVTDFNRLTYPPSERETNRVNWTAVTGGSDSETTKIWIQQ
ncbi:SusD/RagB family nutrient-binding outer membrane lipoprotein [Flagellimonas onchidii]|uniref:SusD/RagB family nutrient-binding outer membrane lipoprotein n=1 Tax=Flagellimonas onchidii TaxID=2562684 RepID=UPI0010A5D31A|nr:SusD/RagB family nutrient-binding outer membrane lipoprotein [Allomuricauda onchidii]